MNYRKLLPCLLMAVAVLSASAPAQAGMLGTAQMQNSVLSNSGVDIAVQRDWIAAQLQRGGVPGEQADVRVASMTDAEVAQIYQRIDEVPAGGADILLIALVVFAVLEITGYIDVIPEIK
jgi:hypothetical protein